MTFRAFTASLLLSSFIIHPVTPLRAQYDKLEDLQKDWDFIKKHSGALKASLDFKTSAQTAAGCFNYAKKDGEFYVLLGLRDDLDCWCTPGGKSKPEQEETLAQTAAQEGAEESFNIYAPHPDALNRLPFVDLVMPKPDPKEKTTLLMRLYFNEVEYLDADVFNDQLSSSESTTLKAEHKEFKKFKQFRVRDLLTAVEKETPLLMTATGEDITLFDPLYQILGTSTGKEILGHLAQGKSIPVKRGLRNRLYVAEIPEAKTPLHTHWDLPDFDPKALHDGIYLKKTGAGDLQRIPFDADAFGRQKATVTQLNRSAEQAFDAQKNRKILGHAVAAKVAANLELKEAFSGREGNLSPKLKTYLAQFQPPAEPPKNSTAWAPKKTLSDNLLQLQLGKDYVHPAADTPEERKKADIANLKKYVALYGYREGELKRRVGQENESDFERMAEFLEKQRQFKNGWIPLIHAASPEVGFLPRMGTHLRQFLTGQLFPAGSTPGLRQTDIYFRKHPSMKASRDLAGTDDYENGNENRRLCANMALTAGLESTNTSSNSLEYFMNAHSVRAPYTLKCFEEAMNLLGLQDASYFPYQALYAQFLAYLGKAIPQSSLMLLLVDPDIFDQYAYAAQGGGAPYTYTDQETKKLQEPTALKNYHLADQELEAKLKEIDPNNTNLKGKRVEHIPEVRFLLHPDMMYDPTKVRVYAQDRFPLDQKRQLKLDHKMRESFMNDFGTWLSQHTKLMPHSFIGGEVLPKKLYAAVYKDLTGQEVQETLTAGAFPHLVKNGHTEGVRQYLESYPDLVRELNLNPRSLAFKALDTGDYALIKLIFEDLLKTTPEALFTPTDVLGMMTYAFFNTKEETCTYVVQNYNMTRVPEPRRKAFAEAALHEDSIDGEKLKFIHDHIFPITPELISDVIQKAKGFELLGIAHLSHIPPLEVADLLLRHIETTQDQAKKEDLTGLLNKQILAQKLSFADVVPSTGNPLVFQTLHHSFITEIENFLKTDPAALELKSKEGLTLYQYMQKCFLEGNPIPLQFTHPLSQRLIQEKRDLNQEAYPPYLEEGGDTGLFNYFNRLPFFANPAFLEWRKTLKAALNSNSLKAIQAAFKGAPERHHLEFYKKKHPADYAAAKTSAKDERTRLIVTDLVKALEASNAAEYDRLLTTLPSHYLTDLDLKELAEKYPQKAEEIKNGHPFVPYPDQEKETLAKLIDADDYRALIQHIDQTIAQTSHGWMLYSTLDGYLPSEIQLRLQLSPQNSFVDLKGLLENKPQEFIQRAKDGKIKPADMDFALNSYFQDVHIDIVKRTLSDIYKNPKDLLNHFLYFYYTQPTLAVFAIDYMGPDFVLKNIPERFMRGLFAALKGHLSAIEAAHPDLITYKEGDRDLFPYFMEEGGPRDIHFVQRHLKRLKETYSDGGLPLIFTLFVDTKLVEQILQLDPTILQLTSRNGVGIEEILTHYIGEDSEFYEKLQKLIKKYKT